MSNYNHSHPDDGTQNLMNKIAFLDSAMREAALPPDEILGMLPIQENNSILDAGAGSGYLTIPAAKQTAGPVFALDLDGRMLGTIGTKAAAENLTNIRLVQGNIKNIPLPDSSVDIALASLILHEVRPLPAILTQISRVLTTGGHLLCLEYEKEESPVKGPPMHIRIPSADMELALIAAGFELVQKVFPRESMYIITAMKSGGASQ